MRYAGDLDLTYEMAYGDASPMTDPVSARVGWQTSAIGTRDLTVEEAREMADYLDEHADDGWLSFILLGEDPAEVAKHLRAEAERAEHKKERYEERFGR